MLLVISSYSVLSIKYLALQSIKYGILIIVYIYVLFSFGVNPYTSSKSYCSHMFRYSGGSCYTVFCTLFLLSHRPRDIRRHALLEHPQPVFIRN